MNKVRPFGVFTTQLDGTKATEKRTAAEQQMIVKTAHRDSGRKQKTVGVGSVGGAATRGGSVNKQNRTQQQIENRGCGCCVLKNASNRDRQRDRETERQSDNTTQIVYYFLIVVFLIIENTDTGRCAARSGAGRGV